MKKIPEVRRMGHVRNDDIRQQLRQEGVLEQVGRKREVWKKRVEKQIGSMAEMAMSGEDQEGGQESDEVMLTG